MLDNMDLETIRKAVKINAGRALLEASGDITGSCLEEYARTGGWILSPAGGADPLLQGFKFKSSD